MITHKPFIIILLIVFILFILFILLFVPPPEKEEQPIQTVQNNQYIKTEEEERYAEYLRLKAEEERCSDKFLRLEESAEEVDGNQKAISVLKEKCLWLFGTLKEDFDGDGEKEILMVTSGADCSSCHIKDIYIIKGNELIFEKEVNEPDVILADKYIGFEIKEALMKDNSPATCCPDKYAVYSYRLRKGGKGLDTFEKFAERFEPIDK